MSEPQPQYRIRIDTNEGLVGAVPHLMGFHPTDSLVLVLMIKKQGGGVSSGPVMRINLPDPECESRDLHSWALQVIKAVPTHLDVIGCAVVTIADKVPDGVWHWLPVSLRLVLNLDVRGEVHATGTRPGATFTCMCGADGCTDTGVLPDVVSEVQVAIAATSGALTYEDRATAVAAGRDLSTKVLERK